VGVGVGLRWVAVVRSVARSVVYATVSAAAAATTTATLRSHIGPSTAFTWSQQPELLAHAVLRGAPHLRVVRVLFRAQAGMLRQASAARHLKPSILAGGLSSSVGGGAAGDPSGRPQRETTAGDHGERPQQETTAGHHSGRPQQETTAGNHSGRPLVSVPILILVFIFILIRGAFCVRSVGKGLSSSLRAARGAAPSARGQPRPRLSGQLWPGLSSGAGGGAAGSTEARRQPPAPRANAERPPYSYSY